MSDFLCLSYILMSILIYLLSFRCPVEKTGTSWVLRATAEDIKRDVDYALEQLGTDYIDIIVMCRVPGDLPIEDVVTNMQEIVKSGKYNLFDAVWRNFNTFILYSTA